MQSLHNSRILSNNNNMEIPLLVKDYPKDCWYSAEGVVFQLADCTQYQLASRLVISGRVKEGLASGKSNTLFVDVAYVSSNPTWNDVWHQAIQNTQRALFATRLKIYSRAVQIMPEPELGLFFSLNFGGSSYLSTETKEKITQIGIQHLIAASGMQVSLLVMVFDQVLLRFSRRIKSSAIFALIVIYVHLGLLSTSLIRAGLMQSLRLLAKTSYRLSSCMWQLIVTAGLILLVWPQLLFEASFQLSFTAVFGIIYTQAKLGSEEIWLSRLEIGSLDRMIAPLARRPRIIPIILEYVKTTLYVSFIVNLWLWPILLYHFAEINLLGLLSSVFLIWLLMPIFVFGLVFTLGIILLPHDFFSEALLWLMLNPVYWLMRVFVAIFNVLSQISSIRVSSITFSPLLAAAWYLLLMLGILVISKTRTRKHESISCRN